MEEILKLLEKREGWYREAIAVSCHAIDRRDNFVFPEGNYKCWLGAATELRELQEILKRDVQTNTLEMDAFDKKSE